MSLHADPNDGTQTTPFPSGGRVFLGPCEKCAEWCAQAEALAEALQPFARLPIAHLAPRPDKYSIYGGLDTTFTVGDVRRAVAALARLPAQARAERRALRRAATLLPLAVASIPQADWTKLTDGAKIELF